MDANARPIELAHMHTNTNIHSDTHAHAHQYIICLLRVEFVRTKIMVNELADMRLKSPSMCAASIGTDKKHLFNILMSMFVVMVMPGPFHVSSPKTVQSLRQITNILC